MPPTSTPSLADRVRAREARAVARAMSLVEDGTDAGRSLLASLFPHSAAARVVGVTGPPGAGKSTLVDHLIDLVRASGRTVGVIAVDPTSPFTGGALLGDRVRMGRHAGDPEVFIRSMATRGHLGGLAEATSDVAVVMAAAGADVIFIETVGVGQDEIEIVRAADVAVVVLVPGTGDDVQALKAGVMEIGDVFVINKADREGAERAAESVAANLSLQTFGSEDWRPPVLRAQATTGAGVADVWKAVDAFCAHPSQREAPRRRARHAWRLRELVTAELSRAVEQTLGTEAWDRVVDDVSRGARDPYAAAADVVARVLRGRGTGVSG